MLKLYLLFMIHNRCCVNSTVLLLSFCFYCKVRLQVALKLCSISKGSVLLAEELELGDNV